ncbi:MAG: LysM peptidoglycan-binding domain-containing protein [Anaerolineae bacterium]
MPPTATFTSTNTPIPPTATFTSTNTPVPPTATFTSTNTPIPPSDVHLHQHAHPPTATFTSTNTPIPPTATFTPTYTPSLTPSATETPFILPTAMLLPTGLPLPTAVRDCPLPEGWVGYIVQASDSLYAIARAVGSTVEALREANCLGAADGVAPGMTVAVPNPPLAAVATSVPVTPSAEMPAPQGCSVPGVRIIAPTAGQSLTGVFNLVGAAGLPDSGYYEVELRPDSTDEYMAYSRGNESVIGGVLAQINSDLFDDGLHWVRLTVYTGGGGAVESCAIPVIFH